MTPSKYINGNKPISILKSSRTPIRNEVLTEGESTISRKRVSFSAKKQIKQFDQSRNLLTFHEHSEQSVSLPSYGSSTVEEACITSDVRETSDILHTNDCMNLTGNLLTNISNKRSNSENCTISSNKKFKENENDTSCVYGENTMYSIHMDISNSNSSGILELNRPAHLTNKDSLGMDLSTSINMDPTEVVSGRIVESNYSEMFTNKHENSEMDLSMTCTNKNPVKILSNQILQPHEMVDFTNNINPSSQIPRSNYAEQMTNKVDRLGINLSSSIVDMEPTKVIVSRILESNHDQELTQNKENIGLDLSINCAMSPTKVISSGILESNNVKPLTDKTDNLGMDLSLTCANINPVKVSSFDILKTNYSALEKIREKSAMDSSVTPVNMDPTEVVSSHILKSNCPDHFTSRGVNPGMDLSLTCVNMNPVKMVSNHIPKINVAEELASNNDRSGINLSMSPVNMEPTKVISSRILESNYANQLVDNRDNGEIDLSLTSANVNPIKVVSSHIPESNYVECIVNKDDELGMDLSMSSVNMEPTRIVSSRIVESNNAKQIANSSKNVGTELSLTCANINPIKITSDILKTNYPAHLADMQENSSIDLSTTSVNMEPTEVVSSQIIKPTFPEDFVSNPMDISIDLSLNCANLNPNEVVPSPISKSRSSEETANIDDRLGMNLSINSSITELTKAISPRNMGSNYAEPISNNYIRSAINLSTHSANMEPTRELDYQEENVASRINTETDLSVSLRNTNPTAAGSLDILGTSYSDQYTDKIKTSSMRSHYSTCSLAKINEHDVSGVTPFNDSVENISTLNVSAGEKMSFLKSLADDNRELLINNQISLNDDVSKDKSSFGCSDYIDNIDPPTFMQDCDYEEQSTLLTSTLTKDTVKEKSHSDFNRDYRYNKMCVKSTHFIDSCETLNQKLKRIISTREHMYKTIKAMSQNKLKTDLLFQTLDRRDNDNEDVIVDSIEIDGSTADDPFVQMNSDIEKYSLRDDCIWNIRELTSERLIVGFISNSLVFRLYWKDWDERSAINISSMEIISLLKDDCKNKFLWLAHDLIKRSLKTDTLISTYKRYEDVLQLLIAISTEVKLALDVAYDIRNLSYFYNMDINKNRISVKVMSSDIKEVHKIFINILPVEEVVPHDIEVERIIGKAQAKSIQDIFIYVKKEKSFLRTYIHDVKAYLDLISANKKR